MMSERDYDNIVYTARTEGIAEGEAKGRAEGMAEGEAKGRAEGEVKGRAEGMAEGEVKGRMEEREKMARMMKAKGLEIRLISEVTGLSEEEILRL